MKKLKKTQEKKRSCGCENILPNKLILILALITFITPILAKADIPVTPYAYYNFNETSGNASNSANPTFNLTQQGVVGSKAGIINNSRGDFSTVNYFKVTGLQGLQETQNASWSFWINISATSGTDRYFITKVESTSGGYLVNWYVPTGTSNIILLIQKAAVSNICNTAGATVTMGVWHHIVGTYNTNNGGNCSVYIDGVFSQSGAASGSSTSASTSILVGANVNAGGQGSNNLYLDELGFWNNYTLTQSDINTLYNNGSGKTYPFTSTNPPTDLIQFISQNPSDITVLNSLTNNLIITYNYNTTGLSNPQLNYTLTGAQLCMQFINGTCVLANNTPTAINPQYNTSDGNYTFNLTQSQYFKYNKLLDDTYFNVAHSITTLANANNLVSTTFFNISNIMTYNLLEIMSESNAQALVYLCNSSYDYASSIVTNANCAEIGRVNATNYTIIRGNSSYNLIPFQILNGKVDGSNVAITDNMSFVLRGTNTGTTNISFVNSQARPSTTKTSINLGTSWTSQSTTYDMILHQFYQASFNYFAQGIYNNTLNYTNTISDLFNTPNFITPPVLTNPLDTTQSTRFLNITWTNATSSGSITSYNLSLLNNDFTFNRTISNKVILNNSFYYDVYNDNLTIGSYWINLVAYDNQGLTSMDRETFNLIRNAQLNINATDNQTGNYIQNLTINVTNIDTLENQIYNTTNFLVSIDLIKNGNYTINVNALNYSTENFNYTTTTSINNKTIQLYPFNSVTIRILDDSNNQPIIQPVGINFVSLNNNYNFTTSTGSILVTNIAEGEYSITINPSVNYTSRSYTLTMFNFTHQNLDARLNINTTTITIYIKNTINNVLPNALITIQKNIGGNYYTIAQDRTDLNGLSRFNLQEGATYRIIIDADGYTEKTALIEFFSANSPYTFVLSTTTGGLFTNILDFIKYSYSPVSGLTISNDTQSFIFNTYSSNSTILYNSITTPQGTLNNTGSPSGMTINKTENLNTYTGQIYPVKYCVLVDSFPTYCFTIQYQIQGAGYNTNLVKSANSVTQDWNDTAGYGKAGYTIIGMFLVLGMCLLLARLTRNPSVVTIGGLFSVIGLGFLGWFDWTQTIALAIIALISFFASRTGGGY